ncbi:phage tail tape measure protein [Rathayibacter sp. VKM Ac-2630]|nr:phage tail tape measure protein [Rathayibacter sp. VKM Ac-2630]
MEDYGISVYDAQGSMLGMSEIAGQLEAAFIGKTDAERDSTLATIFGSDAVRAASVLYNQGADGIQAWIDKTNDAGYAAITAAIKLDNLAGDMEYLQGSIDTALIQAGSGANEVLREMTQRATDLVDWFGALPAPIISTGMAIATTVGGFTLLGGLLLVGATRVGDMRRNLITLNTEMPKTAKFATGAAKGLGAIAALATVATVLSAIATAGFKGAAGLEETAKAAKSLEGLDTLFADLDGASEVEDLGSALDVVLGDDMNSKINRFVSGVNQAFGGPIQDGVKATRDQFAGLDMNLKALVEGGAADTAAEQFERMAQAALAQGYSIEQVKEMFPQYEDALIGASEAQEGGAASAEKNAKQLEVLAGKAQSAEVDIDALADAIRGFGSAQLNVNSATREFEASIDALTESVIANGVSLDVSTEQGRSNQGALDAIAQSALGAAAAILEQTGSQEDASAAVARGRDELIRSLEQFGITGAAAQKYADDLGLIPGSVSTAVGLTGIPEAQTEIDSFIDRNNGATIYMTASVQTKFDSAFALPGAGLSSSGSGVLKKADGGTIWGPGTAWSDTAGIYALSTGEEVVSNKYGQADKHRTTLKAINGGASIDDLRGMLSGAFADGGTAGRVSAYDPAVYAGAYASEGRSFSPGTGGGWGGASSATSTTTLAMVINPQPRQSEREIGQAAADWQTARLRGL